MIANFACNLSKYKKAKFTYCPNEDLTPEFLIRYSQDWFQDKPIKEGEILLVIDECQLLFNALDTRRKNRSDWLRFFTLHGKLGYDIILIAQKDRMIDRQIRGLIEYEFVHRKLSNFGARGFLLRCVTLGCGFVVVQIWYPLKEKLGHEFFRAKKNVYSIYDTYVLFDSQDIQKVPVSQDKTSNSPSLVSNAPKLGKEVILLRSRNSTTAEPKPDKSVPLASSKPRNGYFEHPRTGRNELGWKITDEKHTPQKRPSGPKIAL